MYLQVVNQGNVKVIGNYSFNPRNCIGQGSYGKVYEGHETTTHQKVAIKQMDLRNFERDNYLRKQISVEIEVLKRLRHKNIVRLIDLLQTQNSLYIITEFCQDGDLRDLITRKRFTEQEAVGILFQLIDGFFILDIKKTIFFVFNYMKISLFIKNLNLLYFSFLKENI